MRIIRAIKNRIGFWVARRLRIYLAQTPLIWDDASRVKIGRDVVLNDAILNSRSGSIVIEDGVFFGHSVMVLTGKHDYHRTGLERQRTVVEAGRDIIIRRGAWIASNVTIIGPCEIGEDAVVAAGTIVLGNVPPRCIYNGKGSRPIFPSPAFPRSVKRT